MDEAHLLGKGRYYHEHGYVPSNEIIKKHLERICEIAKPYEYQLLLWSDMFIRIWNKGGYYLSERANVPKEIAASIPESVIPVYWDYYHNDEASYDIMFDIHKQFKRELWFAGDTVGAAKLQMKYKPLIDALFSEVNPIPAKAALAAMGLCSDYARLPLTPMENDAREHLLKCMREVDINI